VFELSPSGQFTVLYAFGTLALCRMTEDTWSGDDIAFLVQVANQIAIAVENSLSYRELTEMRSGSPPKNFIWKTRSASITITGAWWDRVSLSNPF